MSLGGCPSGSIGDCGVDLSVEDALAYADGKGVLSVAAMGNSGSYELYPGKSTHVIGVSASDSTDSIAGFSSRGPDTDLAGPGVSVMAAVPTGLCSLCDPSGYRTLSGTSMATPHVAGSAALIWANFGGRAVVRNRLETYSDDLGTAGLDICYGHGRVNPYRALGGAAQTDSAGTLCPPPANDNFAGATVISGAPYSAFDSTLAATREAGEPAACNDFGSTVWYGLSLPADASITADTLTSNFDTVLGVYTGSSLSSLALVVCNDDIDSVRQSLVSFAASAGTTYYIQLGGWNSESGNYAFHVTSGSPTPKPTPTPVPTATVTPTPTATNTPSP